MCVCVCVCVCVLCVCETEGERKWQCSLHCEDGEEDIDGLCSCVSILDVACIHDLVNKEIGQVVPCEIT